MRKIIILVISVTLSFISEAQNVCREMDEDHTCRKQCDDIYPSEDIRRCENQTIVQIEEFVEVHELLRDPGRELDEINVDAFVNYLKISISSLEKLITRRWNPSDSKHFIFWLINTEEAAEVFQEEDPDFKVFNKLLNKVAPYSGTTY